MEIMERKILLVGRLRIITMTHIQDIVLYILLNHKPGTAAKAQALALADGMKPQTLVLAYALARFHLYDIARLFAQITADIIIIINLSQKADSLTVLALGIYQMLLFGYLANLILDMMADRENRFFQLPALYLSQEIGLVFHRIRTRDKPFIAIFIRFGLRIMPRGDEVIVVTHLLIEGTKLNQAVAHYIRIRRKTSLHLLHRITGYLVPIFMMAVNHLQLAPILSSHSRSHLQVLLRRAVPLLFLLRTNLDVEAIRMQAQLGKLPNHNRTVDATRKEHGNSLILYFVNIQHILSCL